MDKTALYKISYGLYVIGVTSENGFGGCIADAFMQAASDPPTVLLCCMNGNYTNECIKKSGCFTVSVLSDEADPFVIANFGFQSGRDVEKWNNVPHSLMEGLPVLDKACAHYLCRVVKTEELSTHTLFFCEVEDAEKSRGTPLLYATYQSDMKEAVSDAFKEYKKDGQAPTKETEAGTWVCGICGYEYDGAIPFEELPEDWECPVCRQPKEVFSKQ